MLEKVEFKNFKMLRDATLPLSPFTLIVGPNASGKSTALEAMRRGAVAIYTASAADLNRDRYLSIGASPESRIDVTFYGAKSTPGWYGGTLSPQLTFRGSGIPSQILTRSGDLVRNRPNDPLALTLGGITHYALDARKISEPVLLTPAAMLALDGSGLAVVLDRMRDNFPERFKAINLEIAKWLPDYDEILFETPSDGLRAIAMRPRDNHNRKIKAADLSDGTLIALALLTLAYLPIPPSIITIEEPDRGIHPRLLRRLQDAFYRLSYPESVGESRAPVQVIATTHSPYFLELFKEHPEEIVIAEKQGLTATFTQLSKHPHIDEILEDAPLGDAWYSGILGGVPTES